MARFIVPPDPYTVHASDLRPDDLVSHDGHTWLVVSTTTVRRRSEFEQVTVDVDRYCHKARRHVRQSWICDGDYPVTVVATIEVDA